MALAMLRNDDQAVLYATDVFGSSNICLVFMAIIELRKPSIAFVADMIASSSGHPSQLKTSVFFWQASRADALGLVAVKLVEGGATVTELGPRVLMGVFVGVVFAGFVKVFGLTVLVLLILIGVLTFIPLGITKLLVGGDGSAWVMGDIINAQPTDSTSP